MILLARLIHVLFISLTSSETMVKVGDKAPDFTLKNTTKEAVTLSDYLGKTVILAFYPGAFTGVCDKEMCSFQENLVTLNDCNAIVLGISVDSPWANAEFARRYNLEFDLLSDLDREVVELYDTKFVGLGGLEGYVSANRVVIIVDSEGMVQYRWVAENPGVEPNYEELIIRLESN
tara:strand:- start:33094 stop:33621 length:528 start_codon:yes stop_codon:yes gene_type:complete